MKYFTKEWCFGFLSDDETERQVRIYENYIHKIFPALPFPLKILVKNINLHDGILTHAIFSRKKSSLYLKGIFGDLEIGYFIFGLRYFTTNCNHEQIKETVFNNQLIILSDEIEITSDHCFLHRILFSNKESIEIHFKDIEITIKSTTSKSYKKMNCNFKLT